MLIETIYSVKILIIFMMFFYILYLTSAKVYGFDIGSKNIRIGAVTPGKSNQIYLNERGQRVFPNSIGYQQLDVDTDLEKFNWYVGSDTEIIRKQNEAKIVNNPFSFLLQPQNFPLTGVHPIQACAIALQLFITRFNQEMDQLVVAIPSHSSPAYRFAISRILKLTGCKNVFAIDQNSAIATLYSIERMNKTKQKEKTVLFIDIGASHTEINLWKFTPAKKNIESILLFTNYTNDVSGNLIDENMFKEIYHAVNSTRVMNQIIKAKEQLASGGKISIDLSEDYNKTIPVTDEMLNSVSSIMIKRLKDLIDSCPVEPDDVELVGASSRFPPFVKSINEKFTIKRSLNSEEATALGASYYGAIKAKMIAGINISLIKPSQHNLSINANNINYSVVNIGDIFKPLKISIPCQDDISLLLSSNDEPYLNISVDDITKSRKTWENKIPVNNFHIVLNIDHIDSQGSIGVTKVTGTNMNDDYKGPKKKVWVLKAQGSLIGTNKNTPPRSFKFVKNVVQNTRYSMLKQAENHKVEAFIMETQSKLENDQAVLEVSTEKEREKLSKFLNEAKTNLTNGPMNSRQAKQFLESLQRRTRSILIRADEYKTRPIALEKLKKIIRKAKKNAQYSLESQSKIDAFNNYLESTITFKNNAKESDLSETPTILSKDIVRRAETLQKKLKDLLKGAEIDEEL